MRHPFKMILVAAVGGVLVTGAAFAQDATPLPELDPALIEMTSPSASATLQTRGGEQVGVVAFTEREDGKVVVDVTVTGMTPGFHGFHLHTTGICDGSGETPFSSAGGHINMEEHTHRDHHGDLPALLVNEDGTGEMLVVTDRVTFATLFDEDGSAVMVHEGADNLAYIPERYNVVPDETTLNTGDGGPRIACGVISQTSAEAVG